MPKRAKIAATVGKGAIKIDVREYSDGRFGFEFYPPDEEPARYRFRLLKDAERKAQEVLGATSAGRLDLLSIDPGEFAEFLRWKEQRTKLVPIPVVVESFLASKRTKGRSAKHLRGLEYSLTSFARDFDGPIQKLERAAVERWLDGRQVGARRWNNLHADIVSLIRFARRDGLIPAEATPVERIERKTLTYNVATYTPDELKRLLHSVWKEWQPVLALGAFCGLRPEEICPEKESGKRGIRWEHILWTKGKVDVPADVSKTRQRRFAPLTDAARAWLAPWRDETGPVAHPQRFWHYLPTLKKASGVEWKPDALRHSFASYRLALTSDVPALALEMGNSAAMIFRHYVDLKHEAEAIAWFGVRP